MVDILENQAQLIDSLQQEALSLRSKNPTADVSRILAQVNDAAKFLAGLDFYEETQRIRDKRDIAIHNLCTLIDLILGTNTIETMTYTQAQIDAAYGKSKIVLEFFNTHSQELADLQTKLDAALADDTIDKTKIQDLQAQLATSQDNLGKFVAEFTDQPAPTPTPSEPPTGT